jgi:hypothetical protein
MLLIDPTTYMSVTDMKSLCCIWSKTMSKYFNLNDYCNAASQCLSPSVNNYYRAGSDDMVTVNDNESSYKRIGLIPRVLRDVSIYDT